MPRSQTFTTNILQKLKNWRTSLVNQWLRLHASNIGIMSLISDWGTKTPTYLAVWPKHKLKKKKLKKNCNLIYWTRIISHLNEKWNTAKEFDRIYRKMKSLFTAVHITISCPYRTCMKRCQVFLSSHAVGSG